MRYALPFLVNGTLVIALTVTKYGCLSESIYASARGPQNDPLSGASSSRQSVAGTVPTLFSLGSSSTRKLVANCDTVANSFFSTKKLVADEDHETVVSVGESVSSEKRDRD